jgi:hypothetical protein
LLAEALLADQRSKAEMRNGKDSESGRDKFKKFKLAQHREDTALVAQRKAAAPGGLENLRGGIKSTVVEMHAQRAAESNIATKRKVIQDRYREALNSLIKLGFTLNSNGGLDPPSMSAMQKLGIILQKKPVGGLRARQAAVRTARRNPNAVAAAANQAAAAAPTVSIVPRSVDALLDCPVVASSPLDIATTCNAKSVSCPRSVTRVEYQTADISDAAAVRATDVVSFDKAISADPDTSVTDETADAVKDQAAVTDNALSSENHPKGGDAEIDERRCPDKIPGSNLGENAELELSDDSDLD